MPRKGRKVYDRKYEAKRKEKNPQSVNWCFTWNNYDDIPVQQTWQRYLLYGYEQGEEGTPHLQGYVQCKQKMRFNQMKQWLPDAHWEAARGKAKDNQRYCKKDGYYSETGVCVHSGARRDLDEFVVDIKADPRFTALLENHALELARYPHFYEKVRSLVKPVRKEELKVALFYGPPGCGKTKLAYEMFPDAYEFPIGPLWADGYDGQKSVIIDEFDGNFPLKDILRLIDRYPIQIPIKGGFIWWCPTNIILTTNVHPEDWYCYLKRAGSQKALYRRIGLCCVWKTQEQEVPDDIDKVDDVPNLYF